MLSLWILDVHAQFEVLLYTVNFYLVLFLFFFFPCFGFGAGLDGLGGAISSLGTQSSGFTDFWDFSNSSTGKNFNGGWASMWFWPFEPTGWLILVLKTVYIYQVAFYDGIETGPMQFDIARHIFIFMEKTVTPLLQFYKFLWASNVFMGMQHAFTKNMEPCNFV